MLRILSILLFCSFQLLLSQEDNREDAIIEAQPSVEELQNTTSFLEPYNYDANSRRDPFYWMFDEDKATESGGGDTKLTLKSQRFDLEEFSLIGIIWDVKNPRAMFLDPNKELHVLSRDERIGKKNGYIGVIREGEVVVIEPEEIKGKVTYNSKVVPIER